MPLDDAKMRSTEVSQHIIRSRSAFVCETYIRGKNYVLKIYE
jgi:hypothetical protein